jgi:repressor LexA
MPARTKRQSDVLRAIVRGIEENGYRPSYQEIADELGLRARSGVARIVAELESQGLLERSENNGRFSLELKESAALASKDLVSITWLDSDEEDLVLPSFMLGYQSPERIRAFRVPDNAMLDEGIAEDDVVLIELRRSAKDGEIVAAYLRDGFSVLRAFFRSGGEIELRAAGESPHLTYRIPSNQVEIRGVYRGLLKPIS